MKTCNVCGINKSKTEYSVTYGHDGKEYLKNTCKECLKAKRREKTAKNKNNIIKSTENKEIKPIQNKTIEYKPIEKEVTIINNEYTIVDKAFTDKEILAVLLNKDKRIHTVFNLDMAIRDKIKEFAKDKNLNLSDVANLIFNKFFQIGK